MLSSLKLVSVCLLTGFWYRVSMWKDNWTMNKIEVEEEEYLSYRSSSKCGGKRKQGGGPELQSSTLPPLEPQSSEHTAAVAIESRAEMTSPKISDSKRPRRGHRKVYSQVSGR